MNNLNNDIKVEISLSDLQYLKELANGYKIAMEKNEKYSKELVRLQQEVDELNKRLRLFLQLHELKKKLTFSF